MAGIAASMDTYEKMIDVVHRSVARLSCNASDSNRTSANKMSFPIKENHNGFNEKLLGPKKVNRFGGRKW